jgi:DNA helicase-2/ATP-dependent DNA helicase PcrA
VNARSLNACVLELAVMPITPAQIAAAVAFQHAAAQDNTDQVRLVAGPGTGKSASIEERVRWLIAQGVDPEAICAVSFTRASALDLRLRIHGYATEPGYETIDQVPVTTLHSLALRVLRAAGQLKAYPADPLVLDDWELENIFDAEFGHVHGTGTVRRRQIRREHEAFWSTGDWAPPNYLPPDPPITAAERGNFNGFYGPRTQTYACVLPGQIIRLCVQGMEAGLLNAVNLLGLRHLIVDEFQDLNPLDLQFVNHIIQQGATVFVAGDDDQSIYSFRFASPAGIQNFHADYPGAGLHQLTDCFRCTPSILAASMALIGAHPAPGRIAKTHTSLYAAAAPPVQGSVFRWRFTTAKNEARAIAESCRDLIAAGMHHRDILILLSNQRALSRPLMEELGEAGVDAEHPREEGFIDSTTGRLVLAILRIVCNTDDYVSHRALLCLRSGIRIGRCTLVFDAVMGNNLNFRSIFYDPLPGGVFGGHALSTINRARATCEIIQTWEAEDTLAERLEEIAHIVETHYNANQADAFRTFAANLPNGITLEELRDYLWADTDEQQGAVLEATMSRLGEAIPPEGLLPPRVRIMTMHGAKGLSGRVVFIPGLEEEILPGPWRRPYPGLVLEAARLLYVSITRARAACVISLANRRTVNGKSIALAPSRFAANLGGAFASRAAGFTASEIAQIMADCANLF